MQESFKRQPRIDQGIYFEEALLYASKHSSPREFREKAQHMSFIWGTPEDVIYRKLCQYFQRPEINRLAPKWEKGGHVDTPGKVVDASTYAFLFHGTILPEFLWDKGECELAANIENLRAYQHKGVAAVRAMIDVPELGELLRETELKQLTPKSTTEERMSALGKTCRRRAFCVAPSKYRNLGDSIASEVGLPEKYDTAYESLCRWFETGGVADDEGWTKGMLLDVAVEQQTNGNINSRKVNKLYGPICVRQMAKWYSQERTGFHALQMYSNARIL
jgi:hypothetical protein